MVTIPGTRKISRLDENAAAAAVRLTPAELDRLDAALPKGAAAGDRYADMRSVNG